MKLKKLVGSYLFVLILILFFTSLIFWPVFLEKVSLNANSLVSFSDLYGENLPYKNTSNDHLRQFFPYYKFSFDSIRRLQVPFWNPYAFSGQPFLASYQTAVFYPLNLLIFMMPFISFWNLMKMAPMVLGTFFMYIYLRNIEVEKKKLLPIAALYGAFTYGFGALLVSWTEEVLVLSHALIWLPLALFAIDKFKSGKILYLSLLALTVAFSIFAGSPQVTGFLLVFIILYAIFIKKLVPIMFAIALGGVLASVQLFPTFELYQASLRSQVTLNEIIVKTMLSPVQILTFIAPDLFGNPANWNSFAPGIAKYYESMLFIGISALIFALFSIFYAKRDKLIAFYAIFGVVFLTLAFNLPTSRFLFQLPVPLITSGIANRVLFIPAFCFSIICAIGFNYFLKSSHKKKSIVNILRFIAYMYLLILVYFMLVFLNHILVEQLNFPYRIFSYPQGIKGIIISFRNLIIPIAVFAISSLLIILGNFNVKLKKDFIPIVIICLSLLHSFYFAHKFYSFSDKKYVFPQNPTLTFLKSNQGFNRSLVLNGGVFENNYPTFYSLYWPEGYEGLNNKSYSEFILLAEGRDIASNKDRSDVRLDKAIKDISNQNIRSMLDILAIKYVVADGDYESFLGNSNFSKVFEQRNNFHNKTFSVYENKAVMPRVFLASGYLQLPRVDIVSKLFSNGFDMRNTIILEESSPILPQTGDGTAEIESYIPNEVIVKTKSDKSKLLYLSDNYYPGWKAKVDGEETKILRANYTFRAVPLRAGEHTVKFYYESDSFKIGLVLSLIALVAIAVFTLVQILRRD